MIFGNDCSLKIWALEGLEYLPNKSPTKNSHATVCTYLHTYVVVPSNKTKKLLDLHVYKKNYLIFPNLRIFHKYQISCQHILVQRITIHKFWLGHLLTSFQSRNCTKMLDLSFLRVIFSLFYRILEKIFGKERLFVKK